MHIGKGAVFRMIQIEILILVGTLCALGRPFNITFCYLICKMGMILILQGYHDDAFWHIGTEKMTFLVDVSPSL